MNEDDKNKLIKPSEAGKEISKGVSSTPTGGVKIAGRSRLHSALAQGPKEDPEESFRKAAQVIQEAALKNAVDPLTCENRIAIMADCSGSMSGRVISNKSKMDLLKEALRGFIDHVNFENTSVAITTFPLRQGYGWDGEDNSIASGGTTAKDLLSTNKTLLETTAQCLQDGGGTPMHEAMGKVINEIPLTRGIIISDGDADHFELAIAEARNFAKSETMVDTVHIGKSSRGEKLLQEIASITGGFYIKFDDVSSFAKSFSYLSPEGRAKLALAAGPQATLAEKNEVAKLLGAKEIK
jgi:Mg-chelatase subunit ChlD